MKRLIEDMKENAWMNVIMAGFIMAIVIHDIIRAVKSWVWL